MVQHVVANGMETASARQPSTGAENKLATPPPKVPLFRLQPPPSGGRATPQWTTSESHENIRTPGKAEGAEQTGRAVNSFKEPAASRPTSSHSSLSSADDAGMFGSEFPLLGGMEWQCAVWSLPSIVHTSN
jgi:hypothetical protein